MHTQRGLVGPCFCSLSLLLRITAADPVDPPQQDCSIRLIAGSQELACNVWYTAVRQCLSAEKAYILEAVSAITILIHATMSNTQVACRSMYCRASAGFHVVLRHLT